MTKQRMRPFSVQYAFDKAQCQEASGDARVLMIGFKNAAITLAAYAEELERRYVVMSSLVQCCSCKGWFEVSELDPVSPHPESSPICQRCQKVESLAGLLRPLVAIADAYDANALDAEARKWWGDDDNPTMNGRDPARIELYQGRGGKQLLTLADCLQARSVIKGEQS